METTIDLASKPVNVGDFVVFADTNSMLNVGLVIYIWKSGGAKIAYISATKRKLPNGEYKFKTVLVEAHANGADIMRIPEMIATPRILKRPYWISPTQYIDNGPDTQQLLTEGLQLLYKRKQELDEQAKTVS